MTPPRAALTAALLLASLPLAAAPPPAGHITGIGGVFVKSKDPKALAAWYHDMLGLALEPWGGAAIHYDATQHPPAAAWIAVKTASKLTDPSTREFMVDFTVDDLDAIIARLTAHGVPIISQEADQTGKFARILDPDGTKIELWQPAKA
jgi:predicted enzyme related to lactoylglutathione lyase